jgi:cytochrome b
MTKATAWTDRLRDRGFIDQWGFMAFAVAGFAGIVSAKALDIETVWVAIGAVLLMLLYALVIGRSGTGRLRADQAGDNCYYLGLIYTLASLSYAIFTFDPDDTATTVVQGFGIALATTIVGLILRVFFSQGRPDLENAEEETRLELNDAVASLKGELNTAVREMHDFSVRITQVLKEVHTSAVSSIESFTTSSVAGMKEVSETASTAIREEANDFASRSKRYSATFDSLLTKVERHGNLLDEIAQAQQHLTLSSASISTAAKASKSAVEALLMTSDTARASADATQASVSAAAALADQLLEAVNSLRGHITATSAAAESRFHELSVAPTAAAEAVMLGLGRASEALESQLTQLAAFHAKTHSSIAAVVRQTTELAEQQNKALAAELDHSRQLVSKVHTSLADMTNQLATSLERNN